MIPAVGKTSAIQMDFSLSRHKVVGLNGARHNKQSHLANHSSIKLIIIIILAVTFMNYSVSARYVKVKILIGAARISLTGPT